MGVSNKKASASEPRAVARQAAGFARLPHIEIAHGPK
jgi:hypothetical protein